MFDRFTDKARGLVVAAQEQARAMNHHYIGSEHLLLGIIDQETRPGQCTIAQKTLSLMGISIDELGREVERLCEEFGSKDPQGHIPFTSRGKRILELSLGQAVKLDHKEVSARAIYYLV